jgi:uncharacterized protein YcfJ
MSGTVIENRGENTKIQFMKKMILVLAVSSMFVACKDNTEKTAGETTTTEQSVAPVTTQKPVVVRETRYVNTQPAPAPVQQKKGWSKAAKGAVIGAGSGAVVGAVVSKKKGTGAAIGAAAGAVGGYIIGRSKDKKDGRVQ